MTFQTGEWCQGLPLSVRPNQSDFSCLKLVKTFERLSLLQAYIQITYISLTLYSLLFIIPGISNDFDECGRLFVFLTICLNVSESQIYSEDVLKIQLLRLRYQLVCTIQVQYFTINSNYRNMRVVIDSWLAVAEWKWDIPDDHCTICLNQFEMPCSKCKYGGDDCAPVQGNCGHDFHMHCIYKWLEGQEQ